MLVNSVARPTNFSGSIHAWTALMRPSWASAYEPSVAALRSPAIDASQ